MVEMEAWKSCWRNERNVGVRSCSQSAIIIVSGCSSNLVNDMYSLGLLGTQ